jgi:hypothetical protein
MVNGWFAKALPSTSTMHVRRAGAIPVIVPLRLVPGGISRRSCGWHVGRQLPRYKLSA